MNSVVEKKLRLRKLFTKAALENGFWQEIVVLDLFAFFGKYELLPIEKVQEYWQEHLNKIQGGESYISCYLHCPFCAQKCDFCQFYRHQCHPSLLDKYVDSMSAEMKSFQDLFRGIQFKSFSFGGGTPNILKVRHLEQLFRTIRENFVFDEQSEKTVEYNPLHSSRERLAVLADFGINRLTIGVQSLDETILRSMNRSYQTSELVRRCVNEARQFEAFKVINTDLVIGLRNDSPQQVFESFVKLAEMGVDSISVYPLRPVHMYLSQYYNGRLDHFLEELSTKMEGFRDLVLPAARRFGYDCPSFEDVLLTTDSWNFVKRQSVETIRYIYDSKDFLYDFVGFGVGAHSRILSSLLYENRETPEFFKTGSYFPQVRYRCGKYSLFNEKLSFIMDNFVMFNKTSRAQYTRLFKADMGQDFREAIEALEEAGMIRQKGDVIYFLPASRRDRFAGVLFFFRDDVVARGLEDLLSGAKRQEF